MPVASPPARWTAIAAGALDVRGSTTFLPEAEVVLVPVRPGDVLCLTGEGADLWRQLVETGPLADEAVAPDTRAMLLEMDRMGIAGRDPAHPARVRRLDPPTLSSPLHELVYALTAHVAAEHGIPCVFVKGPALHRQGLRDREHSGDVDLWCAPDRWDHLAAALAAWGWHREPHPWYGAQAHHTATMRPTRWGCEIDVHRRMPGLTIDDETAFSIVRRDAVHLRFAGVDVLVPAADTHAVLAAVHAVRPEIGHGDRTPHARAAAVDVLSRAPGTVARARELGAVPVLRTELTTVAPDAELADDDHGTPRDWEWRGQPTRARAYWAALRDEPPISRIRYLIRTVWPSADVALASARRIGDTTTNAGRARYRRLARGIRDWSSGHDRRRSTSRDGARS